jgi:F-type H+-transporting ATPase subunit epsilon
MNKLEIEILSPHGVIFKEKVLSASFPTLSGMITILPGHTDLVTKLCSGEITVRHNECCTKKITVANGFIEITNNIINVISEFATHSDVTNRQKIDQAIKLAQDVKKRRKEFIDMSLVELQLKKSVVELKSGLEFKLKKI